MNPPHLLHLEGMVLIIVVNMMHCSQILYDIWSNDTKGLGKKIHGN